MKMEQQREVKVLNFTTEVYLRKLKILITPIMEFFPEYQGEKPFNIHTSRMTSIGELQLRIVQSLKQMENNKNHDHPIRFLLEWSRFWKIDWQKESIKDLPKLIQDCTRKGKNDALPLEIHGQLLRPDSIIDELDIGEEEVLLFEVRI